MVVIYLPLVCVYYENSRFLHLELTIAFSLVFHASFVYMYAVCYSLYCKFRIACVLEYICAILNVIHSISSGLFSCYLKFDLI